MAGNQRVIGAMLRSAMLALLLVDTTAFMVGVNRMPASRCSSAMVESWYDAKMAAEAEAVVAEPSPAAGTD